MRVRITRNTVAAKRDVFEGDIPDLEPREAAILVQMGKARPLDREDEAYLKRVLREETRRALGQLPDPLPDPPPSSPSSAEVAPVQPDTEFKGG